MEVLTNAEMQRADQLTIAAGTPGFELMLSAGQAVAEAARVLVEEGPILVVAGPGNNGGDGFVAAAELAAQGREVSVILMCERDQLKGDISDLQRDKNYAAKFTEALAPTAVSQRLANERVVIVALPGAQKGTLQQVSNMVETAGAKVTGQIGITDAYADADKERVLDDLVNQLRPTTVGLPQDTSTYDRAAIEIASLDLIMERAEEPKPAPQDDNEMVTYFTTTRGPYKAVSAA